MPKKALVTGATGTVGRALVPRLLHEGVQVRALSRDPRRAAAMLPPAADVVAGDMTDPAAVRRALRGADLVFVVLAEDAGDAVAQALEGGPAERVVLLSAPAPADDRSNPLFVKHVLGEQRLHEAGRPLTVLRSGPFASLALQWAPAVRGGGVVGAVHPDLALPVVDPRDVAEVAARLLLGTAAALPAGPLLQVSGPEALDTHQRVRILAEVLERPLAVRRLSTRAWIRAAGDRLPEAYAHALLGVEEHLLRNPPPVLPTVAHVTGRPARTFRAWAKDHAPLFLGEAPAAGPGDGDAGRSRAVPGAVEQVRQG